MTTHLDCENSKSTPPNPPLLRGGENLKSHRPQLQQLLQESPYQAYVYSYSHKTAYRPIDPAVPLAELWSKQNRQALFLYIHIPLCEMRCGFCNLFTTVKQDEDFVSQYIKAVQRQAQRVKAALGDASFARFALGGGTPTQLPLQGLEAILDIAEGTMGDRLQQIPISVEMSPETVDKDKLQLLRSRGVCRASIGVQSFVDSEVLAIHRRQKASGVEGALTLMREAGFRSINIDLMYGLPGQTVESWLQSIRAALRFQHEKIYTHAIWIRKPEIRQDCRNSPATKQTLHSSYVKNRNGIYQNDQRPLWN